MGAALSIVPDDPTETDLASLAEVANDFHTKSVEAGRSRVEFAIESGKALIAAKDSVPHGKWLPWLETNFNGSQATAKRYMELGRNRSRVIDLVESNPDLSIREAVKSLAEPKSNDDTDDTPPRSNIDRLIRLARRMDDVISDYGSIASELTDKEREHALEFIGEAFTALQEMKEASYVQGR